MYPCNSSGRLLGIRPLLFAFRCRIFMFTFLLSFFLGFLDNNDDILLPLTLTEVSWLVCSTRDFNLFILPLFAVNWFCFLSIPLINVIYGTCSLSESNVSDSKSHWLTSLGKSLLGISIPLMTEVLTTSFTSFYFGTFFGYFFWDPLQLILSTIVSFGEVEIITILGMISIIFCMCWK